MTSEQESTSASLAKQQSISKKPRVVDVSQLLPSTADNINEMVPFPPPTQPSLSVNDNLGLYLAALLHLQLNNASSKGGIANATIACFTAACNFLTYAWPIQEV
jgi:hypothetical protein